MAGRPIIRAKRERLDAEQENIFALIESGHTLDYIAGRYQVGRSTISQWIDKRGLSDAYASARARAADAIAERAIEAAQETRARALIGQADPIEVAATKVAIDVDKWIAGVWNRNKYSEKREATVNINLGKLHLDALRHITINSDE